jgi:hypothetical protein
MAYLLYTAPSLNRPAIYYLWIGLMITFVVVEFILDWLLKVDFRNVQWMVIAYVMLFFGATGGMLGVAAQAGKRWATVAAISFFAMAILAFIQRSITGM